MLIEVSRLPMRTIYNWRGSTIPRFFVSREATHRIDDPLTGDIVFYKAKGSDDGKL